MFYKVTANRWTTVTGTTVKCLLCPHQCQIREGDTGVCRTRTNREGVLYSVAYGNPCSVAVDPVEKKPLYHFLPGTGILSLATAGCNFHCLNCQNSSISQVSPLSFESYDMLPRQVTDMAISCHVPSIAFTYTEPTVFYEYMLDIAMLAREKGLKTVAVSNGYINPEPLAGLIPYLDAANIDLKCFDDKTYRHLTGGRLQPVLDTLLALLGAGVWIEITHLVIPGVTDDPVQFRLMCRWLAGNGFETVPLHISRFFPSYKLKDVAHTPMESVIRARETALDSGLEFVYLGNVPADNDSNTRCHACGRVVVERDHYTPVRLHVTKGACNYCGTFVPGVW
ncbi:MAG TPA: AmmeMemoRadiSam system radical SAM enzyme [Bacteroidales bacterium]|nr:MAG: molybdenum cofactor biosynthesis protein A [Bacteroidetes bacterium ADurb.Bin139]HOG25271.1 AmmeMemoRadiSam system radical SAM enzyme [Bacteroidales bacterium]HOR11165.1 AmmeMemoRadiSam system radical SAM enzyme [Bacteroidales bacterium]HPK38687.1 AmmeMemoRadiSam system radical SAM enzyme [Bacteroidales bacterium]